MPRMLERVWICWIAVCCIGLGSVGCETTNRGGTRYAKKAPGGGNSPLERARAEQIAAEPRGNYYIGRRFHVERTRFWGYLRRPGEPWQSARLVMMNEDYRYVPDRLPEIPEGGGRRFAYDHNYEYKIYGSYSGREVYDPNANLFLPEFVLKNHELINPIPGWLFEPNERYDGKTLPWVPPRS